VTQKKSTTRATTGEARLETAAVSLARVHLHQPGHELLDLVEIRRRCDGGEVDEADV
jgi:hypothetical protein